MLIGADEIAKTPKATIGQASFIAVAILISALQIRYVNEFRHYPLLDIDESGYLQQGWSLANSLKGLNFVEFLSQLFFGRAYAPLVPLLSSFIFLFPGATIEMGIYVSAIMLGATAVVIFRLVKTIRDQTAGWIAGLFILAVPKLIDFSRMFNFAISAVFFLSLVLLFLMETNLMKDRNKSKLTGVAVGLFGLSRTMAIGIIPVIIIIVWLIAYKSHFANHETKMNFKRFVIAGLLTAGPWYLVNALGVATYLLSFGYGSNSKEYGDRKSFFTFDAWSQFTLDFSNSVLLFGLTAVLVFGLITALASSLGSFRRKTSLSQIISWSLFPTVVTFFWTVIALMSTKNAGSGFSLLLLPPLVVVAFSVKAKRLSKTMSFLFVTAIITCLVVNHISKINLNAQATYSTILIPVIGDLVTVDERSEYQRYFMANYSDQRQETGTKGSQSAWNDANAKVLRIIRETNNSCTTVFGFRHNVININSLELLATLEGGANFRAKMISPQTEAQEVNEYFKRIGIDWDLPCTVFTSRGVSGEFMPAPSTANLETALFQRGYSIQKELTLPDTRKLKVWRLQ